MGKLDDTIAHFKGETFLIGNKIGGWTIAKFPHEQAFDELYGTTIVPRNVFASSNPFDFLRRRHEIASRSCRPKVRSNYRLVVLNRLEQFVEEA